MRPSLPAEVRAFLLAHGPSTATSVALGVRARRSTVELVFASGGFRRVPRPDGASPRAVFFDVSPLVPRGRGKPNRALLMLSVLRDGRRHSREEILQLAGGFFLTNNAAAELRRRGFDVRHGRERHLDVYWLVSPAVEEAPSRQLMRRAV